MRRSVVEIDARTGTPRVLARLDGTLTRASARSPSAIARDYVRAKLPALGVSAADGVVGGGITTVVWRQTVDGVPASDRSLRVNLDAYGRVLNVLGAPARSLLGADDDAGGERGRGRAGGAGRRRRPSAAGAPARRRRRVDVRRRHVGAAGHVLRAAGLARAVPRGRDAVYDATVDARTGAVLRRVNMVKSEAPALVWERYPGYGTAADRRPRGARLPARRRDDARGPVRARLQRPRRRRRRRRRRGGRAGGSRTRSSPPPAATRSGCARGRAPARRGRPTASRTRCRPSTSPTASATTWRRSASTASRARTACSSTRWTARPPARTATTPTTRTCSRRPRASRRSCRCTCGGRRSGRSPAAATRRCSTTSTRTGSRTGSSSTPTASAR